MHNRTKIKLLPALILLFCLSLSSVSLGETLELGVGEAVELALEHNLDFKAAVLDRQAAQAARKRAEIVGDPEMLKEAQEVWERQEQLYLERRGDLISAVQSGYQRLLEKEASLESVLKARERAQNQLAVDGRKYEAGLLSSLDVQRVENSLFDASYRYQAALVDLETQRQRFNQLLGLPLDQKIELSERLLLAFIPFELELDACYVLAFEFDPGVLSAKKNVQQAEEGVLAAQSPFTPRVELEQAAADLKRAEIKLEQAEQALYFRIRGAYYALQDLAHSLELTERDLKLQRQNLQAEESKYAAGALSNAAIVAQQESLAQLEQKYSAALLDYSLSRQDLLNTLGKGEWTEDEN